MCFFCPRFLIIRWSLEWGLWNLLVAGFFYFDPSITQLGPVEPPPLRQKHFNKDNFCASHHHHFLPLKEKRDAAYDYLKYWITEKGCSTWPGATHYLGPGGWAVKKTFLTETDNFLNKNQTSYWNEPKTQLGKELKRSDVDKKISRKKNWNLIRDQTTTTRTAATPSSGTTTTITKQQRQQQQKQQRQQHQQRQQLPHQQQQHQDNDDNNGDSNSQLLTSLFVFLFQWRKTQ